MNNVKVFVLMAGMTALVASFGAWFGGTTGLVIALVLGAGMNLFMYWNSASMVLRSYGAQVVDRAQAPELYDMVDRLRQRAGLPMPTVAVAPQDQPNAFATGRDPEHAVVCVTSGLMRVVNKEELEGVIAHELAHIKNRDMLLQTITASMAGIISSLASIAQWGLILGGRSSDDDGPHPLASLAMILVAPFAAMLIQFAISRQREFKADAVGAEIAGRPNGLAGALQKLDAYSKRIPMDVSPAMAPLAMVNPLAGVGGLMSLFSTHPSTEERVRRLVG